MHRTHTIQSCLPHQKGPNSQPNNSSPHNFNRMLCLRCQSHRCFEFVVIFVYIAKQPRPMQHAMSNIEAKFREHQNANTVALRKCITTSPTHQLTQSHAILLPYVQAIREHNAHPNPSSPSLVATTQAPPTPLQTPQYIESLW
jgi:hypothetical protein